MASTDSLEDVTGFAEQNEASFPILSDQDKTMTRAYGALMPVGFAKRWTFYIDQDGIIQKIDKAVQVDTAGADLVNNLRELDAPIAGPAVDDSE